MLHMSFTFQLRMYFRVCRKVAYIPAHCAAAFIFRLILRHYYIAAPSTPDLPLDATEIRRIDSRYRAPTFLPSLAPLPSKVLQTSRRLPRIADVLFLLMKYFRHPLLYNIAFHGISTPAQQLQLPLTSPQHARARIYRLPVDLIGH